MKVFRKIRQQLAAENNVAKYLRYAIGEILLVVIGILIALQVNNWNQNRKESKVELQILFDIQSNLTESLHELQRANVNNRNGIIEFNKLIQHLEKGQPYNPGLDSIFGIIPLWSAPYFTTSAYEAFKSKGPELIKNDSLKKIITQFYDRDISILQNDWDKWEWSINQQIVLPWFVQNCRYQKASGLLASPVDYSAILKDKTLLNILSLVIRSREYGIAKIEQMEVEIELIIAQIEKELQQRGFRKNQE
jgi:hypothetical protein